MEFLGSSDFTTTDGAGPELTCGINRLVMAPSLINGINDTKKKINPIFTAIAQRGLNSEEIT